MSQGNNSGKIVQIIGAVLDVEFPRDAVPSIYEALKIEKAGLTLEVQQQLGDGVVRTIAMGVTDGLVRGMDVTATGEPIKVPVGAGTLGRVMDVLGDAADEGEPVACDEKWAIHREAPKYDELANSTDLLETGIKVIDLLCPFAKGGKVGLFGGAGVGKTTTLTAYSNIINENENKKVIYIALNRLVDEFKEATNKRENKNWQNKDLLIKLILLSKGLEPTDEHINDAKIHLPQNLTLILDGLDEVYDTIPNIIKSISNFKKTYTNTQLIISSRDCVSFLSDIDFLGITLLPFTEIQLNDFVLGWFNENKKKATKLITSVQEGGLYEHIKTPLLATITCTLVEKGINAPSTENEIYSERLRLFTGEYDLHKSIERQNHKSRTLINCAKKIALEMHKQGLRSLTKAKI